MKSLLTCTAVAAVLLLPGSGANAVIVTNLGINPTSAAGDFSAGANGAGGGVAGSFTDQILFQLVGGPQFITVASVTNVFPLGSGSTDFITGFTGNIRLEVGGAPAPTDPIVLGPQLAAPCVPAPTTCQSLAGQALLNPGNYYLELTGSSGGTSGYGGNLAVAPVPGPIVGAGVPGLVAAFGGLLAWRRRLRKAS